MSKNIESLAISALNTELSYNNYLSSYIMDGDRTPLNDGFIYIYKDKNQKNETLHGHVLTQVKGKTVKNNNFKSKFPFKREYIEYFRKYGGIFFVVFINRETEENHIYYRSLTQANCKLLLDIMDKKNNKTKSFDLYKFPKNKTEQVKLLKSIEYDCRKQGNAIIEDVFYINDVKNKVNPEDHNLVLCPQIQGNDDYYHQLFRELSKSRTQIYMKNINFGTQFAIQPTQNRAIQLNENLRISVGDKTYFTNAKFMFNEGNEFLCISKNIKIPLSSDDQDKKRIDWEFSFDDDSLMREKELEFICDLLNNKSYNIDNINVEFEFNMSDNNIENLKNTLKAAQKINTIIQKYGIYKGVSLSKLNNVDYAYLNILKNEQIHKKNLRNISDDNNFGHLAFTIGDIKILTLIIKKDDNYFKVLDVHNPKVEILTNNKNKTYTYHFISLSDYNSDNFFPNIMFENIKTIYNKKDPDIVAQCNMILLNLIRYYDNNNGDIDKDMITFMDDLSNLMLECDDITNMLNYLQVQKRLNNISKENKDYLSSIMNSENNEVRFAASIILENKEFADKCFNLMEDHIQTFYKTLPIYSLYLKL